MRTRKFLSSLIPALPALLAALLVILVVVIFLTAMRSKAHAQFGGVEQPMFQLTSSVSDFDGSLQSIPGIHTYWVWTNGIITNDVLRVTNWTALVSPINNTLKKSGNSSGPINATNGVFFNQFTTAGQMTSSIVKFPSNESYTIAVIQKQRRPSGAPSTTSFLHGHPTPSDSAIYFITATTNLVLDIRPTGGFSSAFSAGYIGTNRSDFVIVCSNNPTLGAGYGGIYAYIDGVLKTNRIDQSYTNFRSPWGLLGASSAASGGNYYDGWIYDIGFWTNIMTSENISNVHYYNTNGYGPTGSGI